MYADKITDSMKRAIDETTRRRKKQADYNREHNIEPVGIVKAVYDLTARLTAGADKDGGKPGQDTTRSAASLPKKELERVIGELENQMKAAAKDLEFERAAVLRDQVYQLRTILAEESNLPAWKKAQILSGEQ
jgi:excinuclease ABC subunit B